MLRNPLEKEAAWGFDKLGDFDLGFVFAIFLLI
jgi:hypothetical protein